jgi:transcriptional regulator GlxA family with amidase domain
MTFSNSFRTLVHQVQFVIAVLQGALGASVGVTLDVLSVANRSAAATAARRPLAWRVVGVSPQVELSNGMTIAAQPLDTVDIPAGAVLVFPGIGLDHPGLGGADAMGDRYAEQRVLRRMAMPDAQAFAQLAGGHRARGGWVAASCSSVLLLASAGLLDGRPATTHWRLDGFMRRNFPQVTLDTRRMVVDTGGVVTAGAAMAQMDLMLYLIRQRAGRGLADLAMKYLLIDDRTTQARYGVWDHVHPGGDDVARSFEALIEASLPDVPSVREAARELHMTEKTMARRLLKATGATPMALIQTVRMRHAERLLALGELSLEEVAQRVGYANATSLRKLTLRMARLPPSKFRGAVPPRA